MADRTRQRGSFDTLPGVPQQPRRMTSRRAFRIALVVALVLHLPFLPTPLGAFLQLLMSPGFEDYDDRASAIVPIDYDLIDKEPTAVEQTPPPPPPAPPVPAAPPKDPNGDKGKAVDLDAGVPRVKTPRKEADAGAPKPSREVHEVAEGSKGNDAGAPDLRDPVAAAGAAGKIASKDANVQVLLAGNVLRKHELGAAFSRMLVLIPEWRAFLQGLEIDPIRDFNHILITAPRLWGDTSKLVAVMDLNVPPTVVHEAVDVVIHRSNGVWMEDAKVTAARVRVGGAPRIFALVPEKKLLVILPAEASGEVDKLNRSKGFRNSTEGIVVSLLTPHRPLRRFFPLPESSKWLRLGVVPTSDGGADVQIEVGDRSSEEAEAHALELTREFDVRRRINVLGVASMEILDPVTFVAKDDVIRGRTHVSGSRLRMILGFVEQEARARLGPPPIPAESPGSTSSR